MCRAPHAELSGVGASRASGRWHTKHPDAALLYCTDHPSAAILEVLISHLGDVRTMPADLVVMEIRIGDGLEWDTPNELPTDWETRVDDTRMCGDSWWRSGWTAVLRVPSALSPSWNYLVNPKHADVKDGENLAVVSVSPLASKIETALAGLRAALLPQ